MPLAPIQSGHTLLRAKSGFLFTRTHPQPAFSRVHPGAPPPFRPRSKAGKLPSANPDRRKHRLLFCTKERLRSPTPPTPIQSPRRRAHVENNDRAHLLCLELSSPNRITHFQFRLDWNTPASVIMISIGRRDKQRHARTINPKYLIHTR